ncbi:ExeM/NucH family extracellular endonuclease [Photobacterium sp. TY1-4]|uniref:ExeM/NucH family extracellular endonuclease n=1 Tax=Photobacterium sp. TY1-4 TaxID=2899122 RepID=UPI0021BE27D7|nr:ExeM/NucH family extracellular endonuclease [Photobacterium sp. TY1-4]UXI00077.1 ExeM/NucH family extracellular endonuclease [Photobacterium sp. TY1-4]
MNKKITVLSAAIATALSAPALADINDIIISEYVEGSSYNKAIELTNLGATDYTFPAHIELSRQKDGKEWSTVVNSKGDPALSGETIPAGKSIIIHQPNPSNSDTNLLDAVSANGKAYGSKAIPTTSVSHNGNDAIALRDMSGETPKILDIVGVLDSADDWGKDVTLRRYNTANAQKSTYTPTDWLFEAKNTFNGLGDPALAEKAVAPTPCTDAAGKFETKVIGEVQGTGYRSPLIADGKFISDTEYQIEGVVSAVGSSLMKGFYLYQSDNNELTSDGVFVATEAFVDESLVGKTVCVIGKVEEAYGLTQILPTDDQWEVKEDAPVPSAVELVRIPADGENFRATLERHEGMKVRLPKDMDSSQQGDQDMRVSRTFSYDYDSRRDNMVLAYTRPNMQPNQQHVAGSVESQLQASQNKNYRLFVDSDKKAPSGEIPYYPDFNTKPHSNYIRVNDSIVGLEGMITYSYGDFRLVPTNEITSKNITRNTPRTSSPELNDETTFEQFPIRIATQNVLNFFNSPYGGADNQHGDNRGAESEIEYIKQKDKIVEAVYGLNADIIGLMEIENNGFGDYSAITELVNAVNEKYTDDRYSARHYKNSVENKYVFVGFDSDGNALLDDLDAIGGDAISSGLLYRPSKVTLEFSKVIPMPYQKAPMITDENGAAIVDSKGEIRESGKNYQRDTVAATFWVNNTGKKLTVAVNHLKSKGSTCWEDWQGWEKWDNFDPAKDDVKDDDFQGSCENFRVAAADHLGKEMAKIGGDRVVMGDMNSYAQEDPMLVLTTIPAGKTLKAARDTFIGYKPQFGENGGVITEDYGYINAVSLKDEANQRTSWSYSYNDEIGSLDHVLITKTLETKLLDATDWHINSSESPLFDYKHKNKGSSTVIDRLYSANAFRSSDHDSAIIALGYGYGETAGERVILASKSDRIEVAYPVKGGTAGQIAKISFSPAPADMTNVALPSVTLKESGDQTVMFDVNGIKPGDYTVTMELLNPLTKAATTEATRTMQVTVIKRDSLTPKTTVQPYDGSGGSFGLFGLLSMLGLGFLRRNKR